MPNKGGSMFLNLENLKEGNLLVFANGWIVQIIRYNKTEAKFRIYYLHINNVSVAHTFQNVPIADYRKIYRNNTFKIHRNFSHRSSRLPFSAIMLSKLRAIITDKKDIKRIKGLIRNVIPEFRFATQHYNGYSNHRNTNQVILPHQTAKYYLRFH